MNARIRAIKASADVAYDAWIARVRIGYLASAFLAIASQMQADAILASRADAQAAYERALAESIEADTTAEWRHVRQCA